MTKSEKTTKITRDVLKAKRNQLFERYEKAPWMMQLALEIKIIDDQIAEEIHREEKERKLTKAG